ncbi:flavin reductase [Micromonospora echinospora]|uniref:flavin reductase n=1 Tax=Micromonospora echinospora TaxID=1877 RepID=UPI0036701F3A
MATSPNDPDTYACSRPGWAAVTAGRRRPEHTAARPSWRCRACGAPWPCSSARLRLLVEYRGNRPTLLIYLNLMMEDAAADLPPGRPDDATSSDLAVRFLSWARAR